MTQDELDKAIPFKLSMGEHLLLKAYSDSSDRMIEMFELTIKNAYQRGYVEGSQMVVKKLGIDDES